MENMANLLRVSEFRKEKKCNRLLNKEKKQMLEERWEGDDS